MHAMFDGEIDFQDYQCRNTKLGEMKGCCQVSDFSITFGDIWQENNIFQSEK